MKSGSLSDRSSIHDMQPHRLLIVEDEIILAMDMKARLTDMGYTVVGMVSTGMDAIAAAEQHLPDLILMDIRLCGRMDGIDAALEIRKCHCFPMIFLTAYADEETRQRAQAVGPHEFLSKLTADSDLHTAIETALAGRPI